MSLMTCTITVSPLDLEDQENRLNEMHYAISHASALFRELARQELPAESVLAMSTFAADALETLAHGQAEVAVRFTMEQQRACKPTIETPPEPKGGKQ